MRDAPSNTDDVIDSRDVIARVEELEAEIEDIESAEDFDALKAKQDNAEVYDELANLKALAEEAEGYAADWHHGATLIRDSYFTEYAEQLADDLGYTKNIEGQGWPFSHIDWEAAAEELKADYTSISFDGVDYWVR